ncbi:MAG: DNA polymerase III subunit delta [Bryobacterales bacterium]|nr:DNA polymerase III subunit delta [Bryobacterales bacterium]
MTPQQFLAQVKSGNLAPVYLFAGPEMYRRRICRRMLIEKFLPEDMREEGFVRHDLDETNLREAVDDASSLSLFVSRRVVWVGAAEAAIPKGNAAEAEAAATAIVTAYVRNPAPDTVVVFDSSRLTFDSDDKTKLERLRKIFGAVKDQVEFVPYSAEEARKVASDLAAKAGLQIAPPALDALVESLGADVARIATEIEKLALFAGAGRKVTEEDIQAMAPDARATTIFALVNALSRGDRAQSLDLLETLVRDGEYLPLALTFLATQFRLALTAKEEGLRTQQQLQGHFAKLGVAMWPSRAQQVMETMNAFPRSRLEMAIRRIYQADKALRDRAPDDRIVIEDFVLALTARA